ncbi:hypothetical protein D3C81_1504260 [compost metagenome]
MAVFWDWEDYTGWIETPVPKGKYQGVVAGVHTYDEVGDVHYGFDVVLLSVPDEIARTVEPRSDSRLV